MTAAQPPALAWADAAERRFGASAEVTERFFEAQADRVAHACLAMAQRFDRGGRLLAFGAGNALTDAQHVSVEFVHPVIVGKRALPAVALGTDMAATLGLAAAGAADIYARQIDTLGRPGDMALGIDPSGEDAAVLNGLRAAQARGMLTLGLTGTGGGRLAQAGLDHVFVVPSEDAAVIQEVHETLYHVLWELVHVFFEHPQILQGETETPAPSGPAGAENGS